MQNKSTLKQRLAEFLDHIDVSQAKFAEMVGLSKGFANNVGDSIRADNLQKISGTYPELNTAWLITGEGNMLKSQYISQSGKGSINVQGFVGQMHGGTFNQDAGKDQVIEKQEKEVSQMFSTLIAELNDFHAISERRDEYMKKQDEYIASIIKHSYLRNRENMERLDKLVEQQAELMRIMSEQNKQTQDRSNRLLDLLEKKI